MCPQSKKKYYLSLSEKILTPTSVYPYFLSNGRLMMKSVLWGPLSFSGPPHKHILP